MTASPLFLRENARNSWGYFEICQEVVKCLVDDHEK